MKLLLDQGLPLSAALELRRAGWTVEHIAELGMSRATDSEIIAYAKKSEFVCITLDADFHALLAIQSATRPSVVRIRKEGLKGPDLAQLINRIWPKIESSLLLGAMVTVSDQAIRIRRLPIVPE